MKPEELFDIPSEELELLLMVREDLDEYEREEIAEELERRGVGPAESFDWTDEDFEGLDEMKEVFANFTTPSVELEILKENPPGWYSPLKRDQQRAASSEGMQSSALLSFPDC